MNNIIKEKIRSIKEEVKVFNLKKESLTDKVKMQENFIDELETRSKENIEEKNEKIKTLQVEVDTHMEKNKLTEADISDLIMEQEKVTGATEKLRTLGSLKGKISQKVSTITKEHKFFTDNVTCPTCTQPIEEEFRINRINDAQNKAKELQAGFKQLEDTLKNEEERERHFTQLSKEITNLTHGISKNNTRISGCQRQIRDLESEIQGITERLANRNTEHDKLANFKDNLTTTYDELSSRKDTINYYDFSYSLLRDGGVKSNIIKKYLPLINEQVNRYLQMMDFYINFT